MGGGEERRKRKLYVCVYIIYVYICLTHMYEHICARTRTHTTCYTYILKPSPIERPTKALALGRSGAGYISAIIE